MIELIYWILAVMVMLSLLILTIRDFIARRKQDKEFREINKKYIEYLNKQIEQLEKIEEDK